MLNLGCVPVNILQNHYVERLGRAVVINVPFLLQGFFATVKPLLDPTTKSKIKFNPTMSDLVPEQQLDAEFGGDLNYQYDSKVYLPALCHFCGVKDDGTRQDVIPKNEKNSRPEEMQRRLTDQRDAADREGDMEKKEQKQRELEAVNEQQETQQPEPSSSNGTAGVAAAAGGAAAAGAAGAAIASQGKKEQQDQKRTQASKPRGGIKLFSRSRGLDKSGTPTIHHHKHVIKSLCMHKGSVEPGSEAAKRQSEVEKTRSAAGDGAEQNGHSAPPVAAAQEVEPASAQRREERVASATPQEPIQSERPHPTQVHSMSQPDQAEAIATPAKLQNRLHSGQSDDLTLAFKVKKAPEGEMLD